jgi:hypothetical protein
MFGDAITLTTDRCPDREQIPEAHVRPIVAALLLSLPMRGNRDSAELLA